MVTLFENIVKAFVWVMFMLFGHPAMWPVVVSFVSAVVTVVVFIMVFLIALPFARSQRLGHWPRRIAKAVLVAQAFFASFVVAGIVGGVCEIRWEIDPVYSVPGPWVGSFVLFVWWITRLGRKKGIEQPDEPYRK